MADALLVSEQICREHPREAEQTILDTIEQLSFEELAAYQEKGLSMQGGYKAIFNRIYRYELRRHLGDRAAPWVPVEDEAIEQTGGGSTLPTSHLASQFVPVSGPAVPTAVTTTTSSSFNSPGSIIGFNTTNPFYALPGPTNVSSRPIFQEPYNLVRSQPPLPGVYPFSFNTHSRSPRVNPSTTTPPLPRPRLSQTSAIEPTASPPKNQERVAPSELAVISEDGNDPLLAKSNDPEPEPGSEQAVATASYVSHPPNSTVSSPHSESIPSLMSLNIFPPSSIPNHSSPPPRAPSPRPIADYGKPSKSIGAARPNCWKCGKHNHNGTGCRAPKRRFCHRYGRHGVTTPSCLRCKNHPVNSMYVQNAPTPPALRRRYNTRTTHPAKPHSPITAPDTHKGPVPRKRGRPPRRQRHAP